MFEEYAKLKKFVDLIGESKNEEEAMTVVAKLILTVETDESLIDEATKYVNDCLTNASIENTSFYA